MRESAKRAKGRKPEEDRARLAVLTCFWRINHYWWAERKLIRV